MIKIEVDQKSFQNIVDALEGLSPKKADSVLNKGFKRAALLVEQKLKVNISGSILNVRSGQLRASIGSRVDSTDSGPVATIGSGARQGRRIPYADIQETGGTIRPKIGQFLTIPLKDAQTPSGVTRFSARDVMGGLTKYRGSFINKGIIFGIINKGRSSKKSIVPLFALKRSVTIKPSHYLTITRNQTEKDATDELVKAVNEALEPKGKQ